MLGVAHGERAPRLLVTADQTALRDVVDQVAGPDAEDGADPVEGRERDGGEVALELADEAGRQARLLRDLADRQAAHRPLLPQPGADADLARLRQAHGHVSVVELNVSTVKLASIRTGTLIILAAALVGAGGAAERATPAASSAADDVRLLMAQIRQI